MGRVTEAARSLRALRLPEGHKILSLRKIIAIALSLAVVFEDCITASLFTPSISL